MNVKDLMMALAECPKVSGDRSIYEAIVMLEANRERYRGQDYRPRVLLVEDEHFRVIGSVGHADILRVLLGGARPAGSGEPGDQSFQAQVSACRERFADIFSTARQLKVKAVAHLPSEAEYVEEDAPIEEAACRLIAGPYMHLFVKSGGEITGIVRMSDLFLQVCRDIKRLGLP